MNLRHLLIGLWLVLFPLAEAVAQSRDTCDFTIQGAVYDQLSKEPLAYASVVLDSLGTGTYTNEEGIFEINGLCDKEYDLNVSYVGYKTVVHHHDFHHPFVEIFLASEETVLSSIVVEAERNSSSLETTTAAQLSGKDLQSVKTESFANAVSEISGVNTISTGQNVAKPIIHGLHSNRILVINNGLRHEFQNWGIDHAPEIDPSAINRIEVVKGAATVRFGPEALGGVILTNPARMELSTPLKGQVSLTGKSNGQSGEGSAELRKGFKWLSLMAGGSYVKQGDLQAPDYSLTNTGKEENSIYGGFRFHPISELDLEGYFSRFDQKLGVLLGSTFGNLDDLEQAISADIPFFTSDFSYDIEPPRQEVVHDLYKLKASYTGQKQSLDIQYGYQINRRKEFGVRRGGAPNIDLELFTQSVDANWLHPTLGPVSGRIGFQWQKQANDNLPGTNTVPFIPNFDSRRFGFFLIESFRSGPNTIELGARYDNMEADITGREPDNTIYRNTIDFQNLTATLGYKRQLSEEHSFRSNLGTAWRPPNVAELYRFGQHAFFLEYGLWRYTIDERFDFISTSQGILTEEDRAVPSEIGYKWINTYEINREGFQLEATAYVNYIQNYIYSKPGGLTRTPRGVFVYFIYDQTDALFWGMDLSSRLKHSEKFTSTFQGSYLWSKQIEENDFFTAQPPANLRYRLNFTPKWKFPAESSFQLQLNYTFEQFQHPRILSVEEFLFANQTGVDRFAEDASDFDLLPPPPAYFLANLSWSASWKQLDWRFQVRNILNTSYRSYTDRMRYFADEMGRNFVLTLNYRF
ncbi:MAG TPA: TonB-dependent receptor [Saprospiraceae bacterium]|nr:TonB-dependent receptor [Saprospiraceae bacterium]